jgi:hypothetical protein
LRTFQKKAKIGNLPKEINGENWESSKKTINGENWEISKKNGENWEPSKK